MQLNTHTFAIMASLFILVGHVYNFCDRAMAGRFYGLNYILLFLFCIVVQMTLTIPRLDTYGKLILLKISSWTKTVEMLVL